MPRGRQHVFNHPQAQREAELEPHREGNDFSGKAVATVERITGGHAPSSPIKLQVPLTLRCQFCLMGADVKQCRKVGTFETSLFLTFDHKDNRDDDIPTGSFT